MQSSFYKKIPPLRKVFFLCLGYCLGVSACNFSLDVFEKNVAIPQQQWQSSFTPEITFTVTDTVSSYNVYLVVRHTDAYNYNNIWIKATVQLPREGITHSQRFNLTLATNEKGWLGSAMDDIYEHRVLVQPQTKFTKSGDYHFTLEQIMREDPLLHVMDVGLRVEKVK
jgi:gliding motility-associated lipoprotein GldH